MNEHDNNYRNSVDIVFKNEREAKERKASRKRRRRFKLALIIVSIVVVLFFYGNSKYSRVAMISISGNQNLDKSTIREIAELDERNLYLLTFPDLIEKKLERNPFIKKAKVTKSKGRIINITVEEERILGYRYGESLEFLLMNGESVVVDDDNLYMIAGIPFISGFKGKELENKLIKSFEEVDYKVVSLMAEIHQYQVSYDDKLLRILMQDGNQVFTSLSTVDSLNYYYDILEKLKISNSCITIDEITGSAISSECPVIKESE